MLYIEKEIVRAFMVLRTVLKVDISCLKCKRKIIKAVSSLEGVDKIEADEAKGTVTVTGNADPYEITVRTRKAGKHAEVVSVGPPPPPPKPEAPKKPEEKKPSDTKPVQKPLIHDPHSYPQNQWIVVVPMGQSYEPNPVPSCSIS